MGTGDVVLLLHHGAGRDCIYTERTGFGEIAMFFGPLVYVSGYLVLLFLAICMACGLYYMAELAEEYSRLTKKILTYCIQGVIGIHVLLLIFDRFPFFTTVYGIGLHVVYYQDSLLPGRASVSCSSDHGVFRAMRLAGAIRLFRVGLARRHCTAIGHTFWRTGHALRGWRQILSPQGTAGLVRPEARRHDVAGGDTQQHVRAARLLRQRHMSRRCLLPACGRPSTSCNDTGMPGVGRSEE